MENKLPSLYGYRVYACKIPVRYLKNLCDPVYISEFVQAFGGVEEYYSFAPMALKIRKLLRETYIRLFNERTEHYKNLERDFLRDHNFVNPIFVTRGSSVWVQKEYFPDILLCGSVGDLFVERFGGSRCLIAQQWDLSYPIKCLVTDWTDKACHPDVYFDKQDIVSAEDCYSHFGKINLDDHWQKISFTKRGLAMCAQEHCHIDIKVNGECYHQSHQIPIRKQIIEDTIAYVKSVI